MCILIQQICDRTQVCDLIVPKEIVTNSVDFFILQQLEKMLQNLHGLPGVKYIVTKETVRIISSELRPVLCANYFLLQDI